MAELLDSFADYKAEGHTWITLATGEYYPDILEDACKLYQPVLELFGQASSEIFCIPQKFCLCRLLTLKKSWMRVQASYA